MMVLKEKDTDVGKTKGLCISEQGGCPKVGAELRDMLSGVVE